MHPLRAVVRVALVSLLVVSVMPLVAPGDASAQAQSARARERRRRTRASRRSAAARRERELAEAREQCVLPTPDAPWEAGAVIVPEDGADDAPPPQATIDDATVDPAVIEAVRDDAPDWALDIEALTHFPIAIGGALTLRSPALVFIRAHGAVVPEPYVAIVDDVLRGAGAYDDQLSSDVRTVATSTVFASLSLGIALESIDLAAGYSLLYRQTSIERAFVVRTLGAEGPALAPAIPEAVPTEALVHMVHGELSARFVIAEHFLLRIGMRWDHAVGAHVDAHLDASADPELDAAVVLAEERVREELESRTFFPTVLVSLGATL